MATKFSEFDAGGAITDTDEAVGLGDVSNDNARWTWLQVWTYISAKVAAIYAPLASPALTGTPTVPTAAPGTNTTQAASTAFVEAESNALAASLDRSNPANPQTIVDEFMFSSTETGEHGELGWSVTNGSANLVNAVADHPGILARASGAVAGVVASMFPAGGGASPVMQIGQFDEQTWEVAPQGTLDADVRFGFSSDFTSATASNGVYFERLAADTNWFAVCRTGGVETRADTGVAFAASWFNLKIRRISATSMGFTVNGGGETTVSTNVPGATTAVLFGNHIIPTTANARTVWIDFFGMKMPAMSR